MPHRLRYDNYYAQDEEMLEWMEMMLQDDSHCAGRLAEAQEVDTSDRRSVGLAGEDYAAHDGAPWDLHASTPYDDERIDGASFGFNTSAGPTNPNVREATFRETTFEQHNGSAPSNHDGDDDEVFDSPDMFEYANPGLHVQYTDTDVDLERSLDLHELLEHDDIGTDALLCYRNERFEDQSIITLEDVENGMDMQGIRWKQGLNAREEYRFYRVTTYENYFNSSPGPFKGPTSPVIYDRPDRSFLNFVQMQTQYKCSLVHFQLRNLLVALDRHSVYHTDASAVKLYNPQDHTCRTVLDLSNVSASYPFKISSLALTPDYCCVGGFSGEYALKYTGSGLQDDKSTENVHVGLVTSDVKGITNHILPQISRSGTPHMRISSNDSCLRNMDVSSLRLTQEQFFDFPVNCSATSTDKRMQVVVGDDCAALLLDAERGEVLKTIKGHTDYSFACAWSNDGHTFATGSQDLTTRLYDARGNTDTPIAILKASIGAIRSLKFSDCGRLLAVAEPADFVSIYDTQDLQHGQRIDFFGEISGIDFAGDSFFVGNADRMIGGIAEFEVHRDRLGIEDYLL